MKAKVVKDVFNYFGWKLLEVGQIVEITEVDDEGDYTVVDEYGGDWNVCADKLEIVEG